MYMYIYIYICIFLTGEDLVNQTSFGRCFWLTWKGPVGRTTRPETGYMTYVSEPQATPYTLKLFDDRSLTIRDHFYPLDDLYCFVNGWYSLDRAATVQNFAYLEEVSEESCKHLAKIVPGYQNITLNDFDKESRSDEALLEALAREGGGFVSEEVVNGMRLHAATKCLLRGRTSGHWAIEGTWLFKAGSAVGFRFWHSKVSFVGLCVLLFA